ncbi:unnamed protein product [Schistosoma mattheei]|uniref:Uncharacterized protein n=1 Tax=Schistosoma mattheei TaxID=31246 RepID=A0A183P3S5_9TREM|nr:unnamed protein product [Schistosoma mattheei]VDP47672.1 unnamed protein product [Schistosoma mattheei]
MTDNTKYLLNVANENLTTSSNRLIPNPCIMLELSSINRNLSINDMQPLKRHVTTRVRIYHYCVLFTSVIGLISISIASVIFCIHTGYYLNQSKYQVNNTYISKTINGFFNYSQWTSLGIFLFGLSLLCISFTLCYFYNSIINRSSINKQGCSRLNHNNSNTQVPTIINNNSTISSNHCFLSPSVNQT